MWSGRFVGRWHQRSSTGHQRDHIPRNAMHKRGLCCRPVSVCLSVCLSVTSSNFLLGPVAPSLWFFFDSSTRTLQWGWKINGVVNFAIFNRNHCLSRKRYEIGPWLLWNVNRKRLVRIETCRFRWPWVNSYPNFKVTTFFEVEYLRNGAGCLRDKVTIEHE